jgi:hypothetical protein
MPMVDTRRLAAADMHGRTGSVRRRRIVLTEFALATLACTALGLLAIFRGGGAWIIFGVWLVGLGANYGVLLAEARRLSRRGALEQEMHGRAIQGELRDAARAQLWLGVPFVLCLANTPRRRRRPPV